MGIKEKLASFVGQKLESVRAGDSKLAIREAAAEAARPIAIESQAFRDGAEIPTEFSADGEGRAPPLHWGSVPPETRELVLLCEDPDAPKPTPFVHWLLYGIPPHVHDLPAAQDRSGSVEEGRNSTMSEGWTPPSPPPRHGVHHYHFELFALDVPLHLKEHEGRGAVVDAMRGHVLAKGELVGTYQRG